MSAFTWEQRNERVTGLRFRGGEKADRARETEHDRAGGQGGAGEKKCGWKKPKKKLSHTAFRNLFPNASSSRRRKHFPVGREVVCQRTQSDIGSGIRARTDTPQAARHCLSQQQAPLHFSARLSTFRSDLRQDLGEARACLCRRAHHTI